LRWERTPSLPCPLAERFADFRFIMPLRRTMIPRDRAIRANATIIQRASGLRPAPAKPNEACRDKGFSHSICDALVLMHSATCSAPVFATEVPRGTCPWYKRGLAYRATVSQRTSTIPAGRPAAEVMATNAGEPPQEHQRQEAPVAEQRWPREYSNWFRKSYRTWPSRLFAKHRPQNGITTFARTRLRRISRTFFSYLP